MNNKSKITKYKLIDTDISKDIAKKIVGKQFTVEKVKIRSMPTKKSRAKAPAWFVDFRNELMQRFQNIDNRFENIENRLDKQDERFENIENRLNTIDNRLDKNDNRFENIEHELSI